jgi:DNA-binding response OmpR family regulator
MPTERVLVIDDQPSLLMLLKVLLERIIPGVEVMTADSASGGLTLHRENPCDLVLTDVNMPREDGFFVLREVKRQWPSVPVVLMSGTPLTEDALAAGADGFLPKPFTLEQLEVVVMAEMGGSRESPLHVHL